jgi:hypothetical protein
MATANETSIHATGETAMWMIPALQPRAEFLGMSPRHPAPPPAVPAQQHRQGRTVMRSTLIAGAIAVGLVALWAALLPLAA